MSTLLSDYVSLGAVLLVAGIYAVNVYCAVHDEKDGKDASARHMESHNCAH